MKDSKEEVGVYIEWYKLDEVGKMWREFDLMIEDFFKRNAQTLLQYEKELDKRKK